MNEKSKPSDRHLLGRLFRSPTFYLIVAILIAAWFGWQWLQDHEIKEVRDSFGLAAIAITLPLHVVMAMTPFPSDLFAIANGALYGLILGTVISCSGWWMAALLQFGLGRRARKDFDFEQQPPNLPAWLRRLPIDHPVYLIGIRQVPWLGMHLGSFVPGAAGVPWKRFAWCSAIGVIPGSLLMTAIGAGLVHWS